MSLYNIRTSTLEDKNFIMATFLRGLYYGETHWTQVPKQIFMDNYKIIIESVLAHPNTMVLVACDVEDPTVIFGYSIVSLDLNTIHWCYVKSRFRNKGIAKSLVPNTAKYASHLSKLGITLLPKVNNPVYNPFSI